MLAAFGYASDLLVKRASLIESLPDGESVKRITLRKFFPLSSRPGWALLVRKDSSRSPGQDAGPISLARCRNLAAGQSRRLALIVSGPLNTSDPTVWIPIGASEGGVNGNTGRSPAAAAKRVTALPANILKRHVV
jgi:hypothetical protein